VDVVSAVEEASALRRGRRSGLVGESLSVTHELRTKKTRVGGRIMRKVAIDDVDNCVQVDKVKRMAAELEARCVCRAQSFENAALIGAYNTATTCHGPKRYFRTEEQLRRVSVIDCNPVSTKTLGKDESTDLMSCCWEHPGTEYSKAISTRLNSKATKRSRKPSFLTGDTDVGQAFEPRRFFESTFSTSRMFFRLEASIWLSL
jgi:hypothetical protein